MGYVEEQKGEVYSVRDSIKEYDVLIIDVRRKNSHIWEDLSIVLLHVMTSGMFSLFMMRIAGLCWFKYY